MRDYSEQNNNQIFTVNHSEKTIKTENFVGYLQTKSGLGLEILPKIDLAADKDNAKTYDAGKTKDIFLKMLYAFFSLDQQILSQISSANLGLSKLPIWESLIAMFLQESQEIIKRSIQKDYQEKEENLSFWKGKLFFQQNLRYNIANKAKFYMRFDEYTPNRAENRLIKSCLEFLRKKSRNNKNQQDIKKQLRYFNEVDFSQSYDSDFAYCQNNRLMSHYQQALRWCKIFLKHKTFSPFSDKHLAISFLFPMEKVFEAYISWCLKIYVKNYTFTQHRKFFCNDPQNFQLKPDFKLEKNGQITILDAKWKCLKPDKESDSSIGKHGIQQKDLYQIFAYSKVFNSSKVFLLYPCSKECKASITLTFNTYQDPKPKCVCFPFDLENEEESVDNPMKLI